MSLFSATFAPTRHKCDDLSIYFGKTIGYTPLEFGHSLTDLLGGQCAAGFIITDLHEDVMTDSPLGKYHPNYIATRAVKM